MAASIVRKIHDDNGRMFERLVYHSKATQDFGSLGLFKLLTEAQLRNEQLQITGHLLFVKGEFTQCLEGPPAHVEQVWQSIQRDPRHHDLQIVARHAAGHRRFPQWSMAFSTYSTFYVHGMRGFFPVDDQGESPLVAICAEAP